LLIVTTALLESLFCPEVTTRSPGSETLHDLDLIALPPADGHEHLLHDELLAGGGRLLTRGGRLRIRRGFGGGCRLSAAAGLSAAAASDGSDCRRLVSLPVEAAAAAGSDDRRR